jgi:hypothetical protein
MVVESKSDNTYLKLGLLVKTTWSDVDSTNINVIDFVNAD